MTESDSDLVSKIEGSHGASDVVETVLKTDDRVLARVTDGIYRQPVSALRELISNSYDADATEVLISTDRPRFARLVIEDDGAGMGPAAVANLIRHIGGSAKRTPGGADLGITNPENPMYSPGGRRLIGKIGIGLFSVAQLTNRFQIITKTAGEAWRTVATVALRQYSDDKFTSSADGAEYNAGLVNIWREPAEDLATHGTTIVLTDIRPQTRDTLRSADIWSAIDANVAIADPAERRDLLPPKYHIGHVGTDEDLLRSLSSTDGEFDHLPWSASDSPSSTFRKLIDAVWAELSLGVPNPQLDRLVDYYLRMLWQLGLSAPLPYVEGHPFDIAFGDTAELFRIPDAPNAAPVRVTVVAGATIRSALKLRPDEVTGKFEVRIDDVVLGRPLLFRDLPTTSHALKKPMLFAAHVREDFAGVPPELSGGPLEFQAYLMWTPKIAPTEHQGVLIRIHGSSGTLFDPTFLRYQVSEQTRLRQITCEILVAAGLEGALNIDRESFNYAHPHVVYLTRWLHAALRRVASTQKREAGGVRESTRAGATAAVQERLDRIATETWQDRSGDDDETPPDVRFDPTRADTKPVPVGDYRYPREAVFGPETDRPAPSKARDLVERRVKAIAQVLAAFGLLDILEQSDQARLLARIREILEAAEE